jgi:hypothetical protein
MFKSHIHFFLKQNLIQLLLTLTSIAILLLPLEIEIAKWFRAMSFGLCSPSLACPALQAAL